MMARIMVLIAGIFLLFECWMSLRPAAAQSLVQQSALLSTYRASFTVACGGAGDCVTISPVSHPVSIRQVWISKPTNAITVSLILRSTADTGGTSTTATDFPLDDSDGAGTPSVKLYTAAPTAGIAIGTLLAQPMGTGDTVVETFGTSNDKPLVLNTQNLAISVSGAATIVGYVEWTQ